jgi:luciferase family oxidoreductase group 1
VTLPFLLSVVDQSPVRAGGSAAEALRESMALAVAAERLGYTRYWAAEHHNTPSFAATSPEILIGQVAARTHTIRVGSGGVMLTNYSALKVAETFRLLEALYPGRIDLGIGRTPGGNPLAARALAHPGMPHKMCDFPEQVRDAIGYLTGSLAPGHPFEHVRAGPGVLDSAPEVWLLGSRYTSADIAARFGLPYSFAHFLGATKDEGPAIVEWYRRTFRPSASLSQPKVQVTVQVLCAETEAKAKRLAQSRNLMHLLAARGQEVAVPAVDTAASFPYTATDRDVLYHYSTGALDGDPMQVREGLETIRTAYQSSDIGLITICHNFADRLRSYALVAEVCGLTPRDAEMASGRINC